MSKPYFGIKDVPEGKHRATYTEALENHQLRWWGVKGENKKGKFARMHIMTPENVNKVHQMEIDKKELMENAWKTKKEDDTMQEMLKRAWEREKERYHKPKI